MKIILKSTNEGRLNYKKQLELDFLRGIFAIFVAIGHTFPFIFDNNHSEIHFRYYFGTNFVVGFVFLSGFLIESSVKLNIDKFIDYKIRDYFFLRLSRIIPMYFTIIIFALILEYFIASNYLDRREVGWENIDLIHILGQIFFLTGLLPDFKFYGSLGATVTLIYEFWFYIFWSLRIFLKKIFISSLILFSTLIILRFIVGLDLSYDLFLFLIIWLVGAYSTKFYQRFVISKIINLIGYFLLFLMTLLYHPSTVHLISNLPIFLNYKLFLIIPFFMIFLSEGFFDFLFLRFKNLCKMLGSMSYPIFLCHGPCLLLGYYCFNSFFFYSSWIGFILLISLIIIISYLFMILIEKPIMELRRRYKVKRRIYSTLSK